MAKGHLYRNCPDNSNRVKDSEVLLATGEDESADDDVYDSTVYLIENGNIDDGSDTSKDAIFFSATEVLLDNQAGRSIFKNRSLLHYTSAVGPFYIGGIDSTSRGLRISEEGDFEDLGRVACETTAAANILSNARLLDAGNAVSYNQSQDIYHLQRNQKTYVSSRKMLRNGLRSSHYACDMANTDQTFVTTVADNMRQYTKREVDQAKVARELMARLGYPSTQEQLVCPMLVSPTVL